MARLARVPILTASYSASRRRVLQSWDRFIVPLPFARGVFVWGEPVTVPADADDAALEAARQALEDRLNAITGEADRRCGWPAIEPAALPDAEGAAAPTAAAGGER